MREVVILGAGPAGLAAAWRLAEAQVPTVVVEREATAGGLCRGSQLAGAHFDLGPHVFKPRTAQVAELWDQFCDGDYEPRRQENSPLYHAGSLHRSNRDIAFAQPWMRKLTMAAQLLRRTARPRPVHSSEDWLVNVRGDGLVDSLYRSREEKLWGLPLAEVDAAWYAAQSAPFAKRLADLASSRIQRTKVKAPNPYHFPAAHPKGGSGQLYAKLFAELSKCPSVRFLFNTEFKSLRHSGQRVESVSVRATASEVDLELDALDCISTVPLRKLIEGLDPAPDAETLAAAQRLLHRDLMIVNLVLPASVRFPYDLVHPLSPDVAAFRVTNFGNLSPHMRSAEGHQPISVEYNCQYDDELWSLDDRAARELAVRELIQMRLLRSADVVLDGAVSRHREAYPVHSLEYRTTSDGLLDHLSRFENLQSIGRNGMFTYNQMSHSVECGLLAAENTLGARHVLSIPPVFDLPF